MEFKYYSDLRILPDFALIELASNCFKIIANGNIEVSRYFENIAFELNKRNPGYLDFAHKKALNHNIDSDFDITSKINKSINFSELEYYDSDNKTDSISNQIALTKVTGDSMCYSNLIENDILVVLCTDKVQNNDIIIINIEGINFVKKYINENGVIKLLSSNPSYSEFTLTNELNFRIIGKVINSIRKIA